MVSSFGAVVNCAINTGKVQVYFYIQSGQWLMCANVILHLSSKGRLNSCGHVLLIIRGQFVPTQVVATE